MKAQTPVLEIWEIQGDGDISPYNNSLVSTYENVVTAIGPDRFFIQTPANRSDNLPETSDGIMVYTGTTPVLSVSDLVNVTGIVQEFQGLTEFSQDGLSFEVLTFNQDLPEPVLLNEMFPSTLPALVHDLERVEGMRVQMNEAIATGPTIYGRVPVTAAAERSFREAGIEYPGEASLPVWDGNPEVFWLDQSVLKNESTPLISGGNQIDALGVMSYANDVYVFYPTTLFDYDDSPLATPVRAREQLEVTIGCINLLVFSDDDPDFEVRLEKAARYVIEMLQAPDVLALQEIENLAVLEKLAQKIEELAPSVQYTPYSLASASDDFSIALGYLLKPSVINPKITALGTSDFLSIGGRLHDRAPLLLEAAFSTVPPTPFNVLNVHIRSLNGIEGSNSDFVRTKRHEQAISIANMVKAKRDDNLIVVGDFNAFQFSDGYVDVLSQITGNSSLGAEYPVDPVNDPPITHHNLSLPENQQYSYVFDGNAQMIDHCLSAELSDLTVNGMAFARANADNPADYLDDIENVYRVSDHDGFVLYLQLQSEIEPYLPPQFSGNFAYPNPFLDYHRIYLNLERGDNLTIQLYALDGKLLFAENLGFFDKGELSILPQFPDLEGLYLLRVYGNHFDEAGLIFLAR